MKPEKLTRMANQIATFMAVKPHQEAVEGIAAHISDYWEPRMREALFELSAQGGADLSPLVKEAVAYIRKPQVFNP